MLGGLGERSKSFGVVVSGGSCCHGARRIKTPMRAACFHSRFWFGMLSLTLVAWSAAAKPRPPLPPWPEGELARWRFDTTNTGGAFLTENLSLQKAGAAGRSICVNRSARGGSCRSSGPMAGRSTSHPLQGRCAFGFLPLRRSEPTTVLRPPTRGACWRLAPGRSMGPGWRVRWALTATDMG